MAAGSGAEEVEAGTLALNFIHTMTSLFHSGSGGETHRAQHDVGGSAQARAVVLYQQAEQQVDIAGASHSKQRSNKRRRGRRGRRRGAAPTRTPLSQRRRQVVARGGVAEVTIPRGVEVTHPTTSMDLCTLPRAPIFSNISEYGGGLPLDLIVFSLAVVLRC
uniref:Uncharacterized protein n=1 Tax=Leersia perrieri TaxID=77586 RepID=A0A0D9X3Z5_9ORYZ